MNARLIAALLLLAPPVMAHRLDEYLQAALLTIGKDSVRVELTLTPGQPISETPQWIKDLAAQRHAFAERLADRQSLTIPSEDPDYGDLGQAFPPWPAPAREAILQPPKPEITPSKRILERAADRDLDMEAAD